MISLKPKIYLTLPVKEKVEQLLRKHCELEKWDKDYPIPRNILLEKVKDVEGLYTSGVKIDEELLGYAQKLRVVSNVSVGYDNFDLEAMKKHKVIGTNTPFVLDETVADLTFALILSTARRISELDRLVKEGKWEQSIDDCLYFGRDVHHTTLGIIGMGRIGQKIARRAKLGFHMDVVYHNRSRNLEAEKKLGATYMPLDELLETADFIVLMVPLTDETYHLIDEREFQLMKKTAIFINVSRGKTVNEKALIQALESGEIYGAGLDVFAKEPIDRDNPLLKMDNVVAVPHIGSATERTRDAMAMRAAKNLINALYGEEPFDKVE